MVYIVATIGSKQSCNEIGIEKVNVFVSFKYVGELLFGSRV